MMIEEFVATWPYLYHVTVLENLPTIRKIRRIYTAEKLLKRAGLEEIGKTRRENEVKVKIEGLRVVIRSQLPLNPECLELDSGWTLFDYVQALNKRVYFWPGTISGPVEDGRKMALRQNDKGTVILRIPTASLFKSNVHVPFFFSSHNTGAAWIENGKKSRRGKDSFLSCVQFKEDAAEVNEAGFEGTTDLPKDTFVSLSFGGPWRLL